MIFGLDAKPGGRRTYETGVFDNMGVIGAYWTSTQSTDFARGWYRGFVNTENRSHRFENFKRNAYSVRCIKN